MGRAGDQAVRLIRIRNADLHQGPRLLGWLHLPRQHRTDSLVRVLRISRQFSALPGGQRRLLLFAFVLVAHVRAALCVLPSRLSVRLVRRLAELDPPEPHAGRPSADRVAWAVAAVSRIIPRATCLTQAIAAQLLLRHHGYAAKLCIGVTRSAAGQFLAHAWLERDGRVLLGGAESAAFTPLPALGSELRQKAPLEAR